MLMVNPNRRTLVKVEVTDAEKRRIPSKHYSYVIKVGWSDESETVIYRRYSKFFDFQIILLETFPYEGGLREPSARIIPFLPGKILFRRSHVRDVAMKRLKPIDEYCKALIKLPSHISHCEHVLDFFETRQDDLNPIREDGFRRRKEGQDIGEISGPMVLEPYVAIADYVSTQIKELTIGVGQKLEVIEKNENGWWFVSNDEGERGWVPGVYLEKPDGSDEDLITKRAEPGQGEHYVTTHEYTAENTEDISFGAGVIVEVLQKNLEGWWLVSLNGKQGNAPASYLEKSHDWVRESKTSISISSPRDLKHRHSLPIESLTSIGVPSQRILNKSSVSNLQSIPSQSDVSEGEPRSPLSPTYREKTVQPPPKRSSVKKINKKRPNAPPPLPPSITQESVYMTVASFNSNIPDGVSFNEEKKVEVLEKSPGGWWYVVVDGNEGWAPASYIEKRENVKPKTIPPTRPGPPQLQKNSLTNETSSTVSSVINSLANRKTQLSNFACNPVRPNVALDKNASPAKRPLPPLPTSASFSNSNETHETYEEVGVSSHQRPVSECMKSDVGVTPALKSVKPKPLPDNKVQDNEASPPVDFRSVLKSSIAAKHNEIKTRSSQSPTRPSKGPNVMLENSKPSQQANGKVSHPKSASNVRKPASIQKSNNLSKENGDSNIMLPKRPVKPTNISSGPPRLPPKPSSSKSKPVSSSVSKDDGVVTDFRSVLRSTQRKQLSDSNSVGRSSSFNSGTSESTKESGKQIKPPSVPKKPNNRPFKPLVTRKMQGTDEIPDGEENDPKITSSRKPVTKPPWNSGGTKPVLRRFQTNNNSNAEAVEKKPVFTVGHLKVELKKTPDLGTSLPKRGSPDGQVDNKFEKYCETGVAPPERMKKLSKNVKQLKKPGLKVAIPSEKATEAVSMDDSPNEYVAISAYSGLEECEISFSCGEEAQVLEKAENSWWYIKIGSRLGWAPSSYFLVNENTDAFAEKSYVSVDGQQSCQYDSVYTEIESEEPPLTFPSNFVAAADFTSEDHSMVSFHAGDEVTITQEASGGWWYAILVNGGGEGWAPSTYFDPV